MATPTPGHDQELTLYQQGLRKLTDSELNTEIRTLSDHEKMRWAKDDSLLVRMKTLALRETMKTLALRELDRRQS